MEHSASEHQLMLRQTAFRSSSTENCPSFLPWYLSCPEKRVLSSAPCGDGQLPFCRSSSGALLSLRPTDAVWLCLLPSWCFEAVWPARCQFLAIGRLVWHCLLQHTYTCINNILRPTRHTCCLSSLSRGGNFQPPFGLKSILVFSSYPSHPMRPTFRYTCSEIHASMRFQHHNQHNPVI